jgi:hypothetical protein
VRNKAVAPHGEAKGSEPQHHEPARVHLSGERGVEGHACAPATGAVFSVIPPEVVIGELLDHDEKYAVA